ncbi:hypothetical protein [Sphingobacterium paludis]|uniref:Uncharacterized protein n=1 Tax=Sphingobacterium paludis TaxID=1476465 RepID=A0A4R7D602_9SPHI|nr:hypothetical protein [Sphingobacterium paludis]TDS16007.1 hypothetical protein B0I21_102329 [Sphingobacterium paludis]
MIIKVLLLRVITRRLSAQQFSFPLYLGAGVVGSTYEEIFASQDNSAGNTSTHPRGVGRAALQQHVKRSEIIRRAKAAISQVGLTFFAFAFSNHRSLASKLPLYVANLTYILMSPLDDLSSIMLSIFLSPLPLSMSYVF